MEAIRLKFIRKFVLAFVIGVMLGFAGSYLQARLQTASYINPTFEAWEEGRLCDAFEGTLKAAGLKVSSFSSEIGGFYARGECVHQDFSRAEKYFRMSGLSTEKEIGHQFFFNAVKLSRDESLLSNPENRIHFENILKQAKKYGEGCPDQRQYRLSDKVFKLFQDQLCGNL